MSDRLFAGALLAVILAYSAIAFTQISAPIQYDPVGPEGWPRILGVLASVALVFVVVRASRKVLAPDRRTILTLVATLALLALYARLFQPLGFVLATILFCSPLMMLLGARPLSALGSGSAIAVAAYLICTRLLDLNLPAGVLEALE